MLKAGSSAPPLELVDIDGGDVVTDPWLDGPVVLAFFKVSCPVCQMVAPTIAALADAGARVVAIGEDPAPALHKYRVEYGQMVTTLSEPAPYPVSVAYDLDSVPTLYLVGSDGVISDAAGVWDRGVWNRLAVAAGGAPVSANGDGLPPYRPG